jgi:hypothetical protein
MMAMALILGCDRPAALAKRQPATRPVVSRDYSAAHDRTTIETSEGTRFIGDRQIWVSASYSFAGTEPAKLINDVTLLIRCVPTGRGIEQEEVLPAHITVDGKRLEPAPMATAASHKGVRYYYFFNLSVRTLRRLADAKSVAIEVNDLTVALDADDRARFDALANTTTLGQSAFSQPAQNHPATQGRSIFDFGK